MPSKGAMIRKTQRLRRRRQHGGCHGIRRDIGQHSHGWSQRDRRCRRRPRFRRIGRSAKLRRLELGQPPRHRRIGGHVRQLGRDWGNRRCGRRWLWRRPRRHARRRGGDRGWPERMRLRPCRPSPPSGRRAARCLLGARFTPTATPVLSGRLGSLRQPRSYRVLVPGPCWISARAATTRVDDLPPLRHGWSVPRESSSSRDEPAQTQPTR